MSERLRMHRILLELVLLLICSGDAKIAAKDHPGEWTRLEAVKQENDGLEEEEEEEEEIDAAKDEIGTIGDGQETTQ